MSERPGDGARSFIGPRLASAALMALGGVVAYGALTVGQTRGYSPVGPGFFPLIVAAGLLGFGALLLARTVLRPDIDLARRAAAEESVTHWPTVGVIAAFLLAYALALGLLGYVLATAAFVPAAARILGSDRPLRDLLIGAVVAVAVYFGFTEAVGMRLPAGLLEPILP